MLSHSAALQRTFWAKYTARPGAVSCNRASMPAADDPSVGILVDRRWPCRAIDRPETGPARLRVRPVVWPALIILPGLIVRPHRNGGRSIGQALPHLDHPLVLLQMLAAARGLGPRDNWDGGQCGRACR